MRSVSSSAALVNSFIARKDLDSEMTVVRNEMEMGENDPDRILMEKTLSAMYQWHNYGKSTIGARADVEGVDISRLQAFYKRHYQPDNATLIISGKFDAAKALAKLVFPTPGTSSMSRCPSERRHITARSMAVRLPCTTLAMLSVMAENSWANVGVGGGGTADTAGKGRRMRAYHCVGPLPSAG